MVVSREHLLADHTIHVIFCITVLSEGPAHSIRVFPIPHLILKLPSEEHGRYMFSSQFW